MWIFPVKIPSPVYNIQILILEMQMDICEVCNLSMSGCKMSAKMKKLEVPGQIENKSYFLPDEAVQTRENSIKNKFLLFDLDIQKICDIRCPENQENLGKRCIRISICPICLIFEIIQRKIFFSLQILGVERQKHSICPNEPGVIEVLPKRFYFVK